jgi:taurine dioxygenase
MECDVVKSDRPLGAEVGNIDLSRPLSDRQVSEVLDAWHENLVLLFRGQSLSDEDLLRVAESFGGAQVAGSRGYYVKAGFDTKSGRVSALPGISIISNLDKDGKPVDFHAGTGSQPLGWHTDNSYVDTPPKGSILYGLRTPVDGGGNTSFANQYVAYETLPEATKARIEGLHVKHDTSRNTAGNLRPTADLPSTYEEVVGPIHPLVRVHPATGRRALYLGRRYACPSSYIVEMPTAEGEALLDELWAHATDESLTWTQHWQPGDVLMWDNRCVMHARSPIDSNQPREMHRTLIAGEPVASAWG